MPRRNQEMIIEGSNHLNYPSEEKKGILWRLWIVFLFDLNRMLCVHLGPFIKISVLEYTERSFDTITWADFYCCQYLALENACFSQNTRLKEIICCYYCISYPLFTSLLNKEMTALLRVKNQMAADLERLLNDREVIFLF